MLRDPTIKDQMFTAGMFGALQSDQSERSITWH